MSRILLPNLNNKDTMCNTNVAIAPKSTNTNQKVPKLKILPASIKPTFNADISSKTNNTLMHNNCNYNINILLIFYFLPFIFNFTIFYSQRFFNAD